MYALEPTRCPLVLSSPQAHRLHCALLFDLWAGALPPEVRHQGVPLPLLAIESEMWAMGKWGIEQIQHEENQRCAFYAPSTQHQSFSDAALWMPSCIARRTRAMGDDEERHMLHRTVACVAGAFASRARSLDKAAGSAARSAQQPFATPQALLREARINTKGRVLVPLTPERGSKAFNL